MSELNCEIVGDVAVIRPEGRLDAFTVDVVDAWLNEMHAAGRTRIVMNMSAVGFMDTHVISVLVQTMKRCRDAGGDFVLCALTKPIRIILELMRLDLAFTIVENEAEAISG